MKTSISLTILVLFLTLMNCSKKEAVVEETQEQIQKRLRKEEGENMILGSWKLLHIFRSQRIRADSIGIHKTIVFNKNGICSIDYKDSISQYNRNIKYTTDGLSQGIGPKRYIYFIDDIYDQMVIYQGNSDTLFTSSSKIEGLMTYVRIKK